MKLTSTNLMLIKIHCKKLYFSSQFIKQRGNGRKTWQTIDDALHKKKHIKVHCTLKNIQTCNAHSTNRVF